MLTMMMVAFASLCFTACGDDDDTGGDGTPTSGKWYLVSYDSEPCTHGEYIQFKSGNKLEWNSRLGGKNTTYDCRVAGDSFYLTNCSDGSKDVSFYIEAYTVNGMVTSSSDGFVRTWKR